MKKFLILTLTALLALSVFAGCSNNKVADWDYIVKNGKIVVGFDPHFPPMGFFENPDDIDPKKATGFDIDAAKALGELLEVDVEFKSIDWSQKEMLLKTKNIDLIWNGYTMTDARAKNHLFSVPYMKNEQAIVIRTADIEKYTTIESIAAAGVIIGYQTGSSAEGVVTTHETLKTKTNSRSIKDYGQALTDLKMKVIDCIVMDSVAAGYYIEKNDGDYHIISGISLGDENYGIGIRQGASLTLYKINNALLQLQKSGKLLEIAAKYKLENDLLLK